MKNLEKTSVLLKLTNTEKRQDWPTSEDKLKRVFSFMPEDRKREPLTEDLRKITPKHLLTFF